MPFKDIKYSDFITSPHHLKYQTHTTAFSSWTWKCLLFKWWECYLNSCNGWRTISLSSSQSLVSGEEESPNSFAVHMWTGKMSQDSCKVDLRISSWKLRWSSKIYELPQQQFQKMLMTEQLPPRLCSCKMCWVLTGLKASHFSYCSCFPHSPEGTLGETNTHGISMVQIWNRIVMAWHFKLDSNGTDSSGKLT